MPREGLTWQEQAQRVVRVGFLGGHSGASAPCPVLGAGGRGHASAGPPPLPASSSWWPGTLGLPWLAAKSPGLRLSCPVSSSLRVWPKSPVLTSTAVTGLGPARAPPVEAIAREDPLPVRAQLRGPGLDVPMSLWGTRFFP